MIESTPPLVILKAIFRPYGARLPKKKPRYEYNYNHSHTHTPFVPLGSSQRPYGPNLFGLTEGEYFLWYGADSSSSNWSVCRACQAIRFGQLDRSTHASLGCAEVIYRALARLRALPKQCAVCNKMLSADHRIRYGVYLCEGDCVTKWKFADRDVHARKNLKEALRLSGYVEETYS